MNKAEFPFVCLMIVAVFCSSTSQIILKKAASKTYDSLIKEYMNFPVIFSYAIFFLATLMTVFALRYVPLSMAPIIDSIGYIFVIILGRLFLKEHITRKQYIGSAIIVLGVLVFSL